jgi:hypothetical protein
MKRSSLAEGLKSAANKPLVMPTKEAASLSTVLIGAHFSPQVRSALRMIQAEPRNAGRNLKQLLGEAINDLCAKYGKPQPYTGEK